MGFTVEMTGRADYYDTIKMAIVGQAGAGKTLFSSTAPDPLFLFFREQPRIMSIANRAVPHVKVMPEYDADGKMVKPVEDIMLEVLEYVGGEGSDYYSTVVIDTGDELQKALKEGKKVRNRGKWGIADWGWLADEYTAIVNAFVDLPKNVIVTYHSKNTQEGEDGQIFKEIALQGSAKDDAPGWFDVVGVLDTYESVDEKGIRSTQRGLLTRPTPRYGWVKDHSGQLPPVFDLSENFIGDFDRLYGLIYGETSPVTQKSDHEVITVVKPSPKPEIVEEHPGIPTPDEVDAKKQEKVTEVQAVELLKNELGAEEVTEEEVEVATVEQPREIVETEALSLALSDDGAVGESENVEVVAADDGEPGTVGGDGGDSDDDPYKGQRCEVCETVVTTAKYDENGEAVLDGESNPVMVIDDTLINLGKVKFRKVLCQEHLLEARKNG